MFLILAETGYPVFVNTANSNIYSMPAILKVKMRYINIENFGISKFQGKILSEKTFGQICHYFVRTFGLFFIFSVQIVWYS